MMITAANTEFNDRALFGVNVPLHTFFFFFFLDSREAVFDTCNESAH